MQKVTNRISLPKPKPLLLPPLALRRVMSKSGRGVYASSDTLFKGAIFGRDSIEVAEDLLYVRPKLVRRIILTLASLQGEVDNEQSEEEPGKIIHEYRTTVVDGKPLDDVSRHIFEELSLRWGGNENELAYFGSIDSTPHFIRLLGRYTEHYGTSILNERIRLRSGHKLSMAIVLENAVGWLNGQLDKSRSGLLEYQRRNPQGIENQVWKDSGEFYVHEDGSPANHKAPIASIEVQGLAYDALQAAAWLMPQRADELISRSKKLRDTTIWLLWQPYRHYFALGTDYGPDGELRIINTFSANAAALLDTSFFDGLPEPHRQEYIRGIVRNIMSREFLTDAGIRSRALKAADLVPFWDYHGSYTSWPKETYDIAKGLRRQGFPKLARQLENRLLNVVFKNWEYPEFLYVDAWGRVMAVSPTSNARSGEVIFIDSTNSPERVQAWTVSAILAIISARVKSKVTLPKTERQPGWAAQLEQKILRRIPHINRIVNPVTLRLRYPTYAYTLVKRKSRTSSNFLHDKIPKA